MTSNSPNKKSKWKVAKKLVTKYNKGNNLAFQIQEVGQSMLKKKNSELRSDQSD